MSHCVRQAERRSVACIATQILAKAVISRTLSLSQLLMRHGLPKFCGHAEAGSKGHIGWTACAGMWTSSVENHFAGQGVRDCLSLSRACARGSVEMLSILCHEHYKGRAERGSGQSAAPRVAGSLDERVRHLRKLQTAIPGQRTRHQLCGVRRDGHGRAASGDQVCREQQLAFG